VSDPDPRAALLREIRTLLAGWLADGVSHVPHAAPLRASAAASVAAPGVASPGVASPRVAARAVSRATITEPVRVDRDPTDRAAEAERAAPGTALELDPAAELAAIRADLGDCQRCGLCGTRNQIVFGEGNPRAPVVFVGEGPGADEDRTGRPFVGRAGELLTRMIEAVGWQRSDVYICNVVKCRPPGNRDPGDAEVASCRPFLERQLLAIRPRVIVSLGRPATSTLLGGPVSITKVRGHWHEWRGTALMPTFHPAYLLRSYTRETRQAVWDDLRAARARADEPVTPS
jgi:DNA polymerase